MGDDDKRVEAPGGRRQSNHGWVVHARENWYRDVWLAIISAVVLVAVFKAIDAGNQARNQAAAIQQNRITVIRQNCEDQNARYSNTVNQLKSFAGLAPSKKGQKLPPTAQTELTLGLDALTRLTAESLAARSDPADATAEITHLRAFVRLSEAQQRSGFGFASTVALIAALAPPRDCDAVVKAARLKG